MIELKNTVVVSSEQISTDMVNETVILNMENGVYYGLDEVGTFIWHRIQSPHSVEEVVEAILEEYDVDKELASGDTLRLLTDLYSMGLLRIIV